MNSIIPHLYLYPRKEESLQRFHPWVFSGAIASANAPLQEGQLVRLFSDRGEPLGIGHWADGSIAVRLLSFDVEEAIDEEFWRKRLASALRLRQSSGLLREQDPEHTRNNVYRLIHGEGDRLPGLIIDMYGDIAVLQAHSMGMHEHRHAIAQALMQLYQEEFGTTALRAIYYKSKGTLPKREQRDVCIDEFLIGNASPQLVWENGLRFLPDWLNGQKTGFFIDQRDNRALVEHYASERNVLNAFCYTGGFSLYALRGGARSVDSLDSSAQAMSLTEQHIALNFGDTMHHSSITQDAFDYLETMPQDAYDLIILDPPAFAKHRKVIRNALLGYRRINSLAFRKVAPGGLIFTFSCSQAVSKEEFRLAVFTAAASSGRHVRILHQLTQPIDHPVSIYHPEGEYLKGLVLQVD